MKPYPLILLLLVTFVARGQLKLTVTSVNNSVCGMDNGSISAVASNGVPPYEYSLQGVIGFSTGNFTSLPPGEYLVATRDAAGTILSQTVFITNIPTTPPAPTFSIQNPSACDKLDGVMTVNMSGGSPPFQYSLDDYNYQSSNVFTGLTHGIYYVYIKDANGCRRTRTAANVFAPNCGYTISITGSFATCGNTGRLTVADPQPGIAPRKYSIDGINYQNSNVFTNLAPGVYTIRIKDGADVVRLFSVQAIYQCVMQLSLVTVNAGCSNTFGSITATPVRGQGPYQYSINNGPYQTSNTFDFLQPGNYEVKVRDVRGLTISATTTVANSCPTATTTTKDATCGKSNAEIEVTGSGGTAPYEFSIDGINYQVSNRFTGLAAAKYNVSVKDAVGSVNTSNVVVNGQPGTKVSGTAVAASCDDNDGKINAVSGSGQSPFAYSISSSKFQSSPAFNNLASGNYKLMIKDANGCGDTADVIVPLRNSLALSLDSQVTICEGKVASLKVSSNASTFQWAPGTGITEPGKRDQNVAPVTTTQYAITATTGKCTLSDTVLVVVNAAPHANAGQDQTICFGEDAKLAGSGGLNFNWTPARYLTDSRISNPVSVKPAATLEYALTVMDALGCSSIQPDVVNITVTIPKIFAGNDTSVMANQPFNLLAADVSNSGFIEYNWQPGTGLSDPRSANPVATLDRNTTYRVTARTATGCEASDNVTVLTYISADIYVPNAFTPNGDGHNDYARPILLGIKELKNFTIYNRWGSIVYRFTPGSTGWDGRLNGVLQNSGSFAWVAEGLDFHGTMIKRYGTISLVR